MMAPLPLLLTMLRKSLIAAVLCLAVCSLVAGHGLMTNPVARSGEDDTAKNPCSATPGTIAAIYEAGTTISVGWKIVVSHGGSVTWSISYTGNPANFEPIGGSSPVNGNGPSTAQLALPAGRTCEQCLLRWTWQPNTEPEQYIGCSDVKITGTNTESILCRSGLISCNSASTTTLSAFLVLLVALIAVLML